MSAGGTADPALNMKGEKRMFAETEKVLAQVKEKVAEMGDSL